MNFFKKLSISSYISLVSLVVGIVAFIFYFVTKGTAGYFESAKVGVTVALTIVALVALVAVLVIRALDLKVEGIVKTVVDVVCGIVSAAVSVLFALSAMFYISPKVEGLAFIYFSNADVAATIQTPANLASSKLAIATCVLLLVAAIVQVVSCFFSGKKEVAEKAADVA